MKAISCSHNTQKMGHHWLCAQPNYDRKPCPAITLQH